MAWKCAVCDGSKVQVCRWIDANTLRVVGDGPIEWAWCADCETEVDLAETE